MDSSRVNQILKEWATIAGQARRPASSLSSAAPGRVVVRSGLSGATLAGAGLVAAGLVVAAVWFGGLGPNGVGGAPTLAPTIGPVNPCDPATLRAGITRWEGAAGQRIAHVELTTTGSDDCTVPAMAKPQLVDGEGTVLIDGANPATSDVVLVSTGVVLTTLVEAGNYCGPARAGPVSIAFVFGDRRTIVAKPASATDVTLPPCNGAGQAADIQMQPWAAP